MTEKLFYQDSYVSEFEANVLSCNPLGSDGKSEAKYEAVLDRTAFFPEGGGQSSDTGTLCAGEQIVQVLENRSYRFLTCRKKMEWYCIIPVSFWSQVQWFVEN